MPTSVLRAGPSHAYRCNLPASAPSSHHDLMDFSFCNGNASKIRCDASHHSENEFFARHQRQHGKGELLGGTPFCKL